MSSGQALPLLTPMSVANDLDVRYEAYDLVIEFDPALLTAHPNLEIEFPHYRFSGSTYRSSPEREPVGTSEFRLSLVQPGPFAFRVIAPGRWSRSLVVEIEDSDLTVPFVK